MGSSADANLVYGYCIDWDYGSNGIPEYEELESLAEEAEVELETKEAWIWKTAHDNLPVDKQNPDACYDWEWESPVLKHCGGLTAKNNGNACYDSGDEALFVCGLNFWAYGYGYEAVDLSDLNTQTNSVSSKLHKFSELLPMMDLGKPKWYLVASYG